MWNTADSVSGWNIEKHRPAKTECEHCKENCKCVLSRLLHCDYMKNGFCNLSSKKSMVKY